jgi:hypothetical protein
MVFRYLPVVFCFFMCVEVQWQAECSYVGISISGHFTTTQYLGGALYKEHQKMMLGGGNNATEIKFCGVVRAAGLFGRASRIWAFLCVFAAG